MCSLMQLICKIVLIVTFNVEKCRMCGGIDGTNKRLHMKEGGRIGGRCVHTTVNRNARGTY